MSVTEHLASIGKVVRTLAGKSYLGVKCFVVFRDMLQVYVCPFYCLSLCLSTRYFKYDELIPHEVIRLIYTY
jgi:hypothetical protein